MSDAPRPCPSDWEARWKVGDVPWDLGRAPPVLEQLVERLGGARREVVVPGAGRGHDAVAWARAGHVVTALDIAPSAVVKGRELAASSGVEIEWVEGDLFAPPEVLLGRFDAAWEQTCFCAFPPERRAEYVERVADMLKPGGVLYALLWNHGADGGPPYDVTHEDARRVLEARFDVRSIEDVECWTRERKHEFLVTAVR